MAYNILGCIIMGLLIGSIGAWINLPLVVSFVLSFLAGVTYAEKFGDWLKLKMEG